MEKEQGQIKETLDIQHGEDGVIYVKNKGETITHSLFWLHGLAMTGQFFLNYILKGNFTVPSVKLLSLTQLGFQLSTTNSPFKRALVFSWEESKCMVLYIF